MRYSFAGIVLLVASGCAANSGPQLPPGVHLGSGASQVLNKAAVATGVDSSGGDEGLVPEIASTKLFSLPAHKGQIFALVSSQDGTVVYSGGDDGVVKMTSVLPDKSILQQAILTSEKKILSLALSPDGAKLAVGQRSQIYIYDIVQRKITAKLSKVLGRVSSLAWSNDGRLLAIGRANGDVVVWTIVGGDFAGRDNSNAIELYRGGGAPVVDLIFHPTGRAFFAGYQNGRINLWRLIQTERQMGLRDEDAIGDNEGIGRARAQFEIPTRLEAFWLDQTGSHMVLAGSDGKLYRAKIRGMRVYGAMSAGSGVLTGIASVQSGDEGQAVLATVSRDQRIRLWCAKGLEFEAIASSELLAESVGVLAGSSASPYLWGGAKVR